MKYLDAKNLYTELKSEKYMWFPKNPVYMDVQSRYELAILNLYKEKFGKKIKDWQKAYSKLKNDFESELLEIVKPFQDEVSAEYNRLKNIREDIEKQLESFAKGFNPEKKMELVHIKTASGGNWHTQGYGANKYARESLNEDVRLLELLGFTVEVKNSGGHSSGGQFPVYHEDYQLWANIDIFDYYLLGKSGKFISVLNWAVMCWQKGTNPKVYFPFLSDGDYQKSQELAYKTNYKITVENMSLELSQAEIDLLKTK
jgi:hypothetical protein